MPHCPDCNKFVGFADEPEVELIYVEVDDQVTVHAFAQLYLDCGECGSQLKELELEAEAEIGHVCEGEGAIDEDVIEVAEEGEPEPINKMEEKRMNYGFALDVDLKCQRCGEEFTRRLEAMEPASTFSEV